MNPRRVAMSTDKHGRRNTNNARQKAYRLRKAGHVEVSCPLCSAKFSRQIRCPKFDDVTVAAAAVQAKEKEFKRLYAFLYTKDYGKAAVAFKQAMQEAHPDHGGDPEAASRIIVAWDEYKKGRGWEGPAPTVTPEVKTQLLERLQKTRFKKRKRRLKSATSSPTVTNTDTHIFTAGAGGYPSVTPLCLLRAGKRAKRGEYVGAEGKPATCKACRDAVTKFEETDDEREFNARRQKEKEAATARCNHTEPKDDDCLICFPVDDEPTVTPVRKRKPVRKAVTHIPNLNPDCAEYTTACGKSVEDVTVVDANCSAAALPRLVTCKKCRAAWRAPTVTTEEDKRRQFRKELDAEKQSVMEAIYK